MCHTRTPAILIYGFLFFHVRERTQLHCKVTNKPKIGASNSIAVPRLIMSLCGPFVALIAIAFGTSETIKKQNSLQSGMRTRPINTRVCNVLDQLDLQLFLMYENEWHRNQATDPKNVKCKIHSCTNYLFFVCSIVFVAGRFI